MFIVNGVAHVLAAIVHEIPQNGVTRYGYGLPLLAAYCFATALWCRNRQREERFLLAGMGITALAMTALAILTRVPCWDDYYAGCGDNAANSIASRVATIMLVLCFCLGAAYRRAFALLMFGVTVWYNEYLAWFFHVEYAMTIHWIFFGVAMTFITAWAVWSGVIAWQQGPQFVRKARRVIRSKIRLSNMTANAPE